VSEMTKAHLKFDHATCEVILSDWKEVIPQFEEDLIAKETGLIETWHPNKASSAIREEDLDRLWVDFKPAALIKMEINEMETTRIHRQITIDRVRHDLRGRAGKVAVAVVAGYEVDKWHNSLVPPSVFTRTII